jgi:chromosome segregation protein
MGKDAQGTRAALEEKEKALASLGEREVAAERELSLMRLKAEKNSEEAERTGRKLSLLKIELQEIQREEESLRAEAEARRGEITRREEARTTSERAMAELAEEISSARQLFEQRSSESVELRLSLNSLKERLASLEADEQNIARLMAELSDKKSLLIKEARDAESRIRTDEEEAEAKEEALKGHAVRASELSAIISQKKDVITGESDGIHESERELKSLRLKIDDSTHRLSELEVRRAENKLKIENLEANIMNAYGLGLDGVEAGEVTDEEEERLPEIKSRIESLGPVSLGSIEEYEELKERYAFLTGQKEDLEKSIAELEEAISRINSTTRKKLREAYEVLRAKFSEVFITLFGGGRAELLLTDEKNILETGIDIIAQPPGKKLQNISLLSGGEKSLTALALLFASFLIKPTPLCILDEADAALDESNTYKFSDMLRELSRDTQFIVVTHNRVTMEAADFIYGITMEEPGNSKVISLEMARA